MIDRVDRFVMLDDVQFIRREWKNRNRVRKDRRSIETKWLTVPLHRKSQRNTRICDAEIDEGSDWRQKHRDSLRQVYGKAPHFADVEGVLDGVNGDGRTLGDLNAALLQGFCCYLGIETELVRSSEMHVEGRKTEKLANLCTKIGAGFYLANNGSAAYLDPRCFSSRGIEWAFQDYRHPTYLQITGGEELPFLPYLSVVDLISNHGQHSLEILRQGRS